MGASPYRKGVWEQKVLMAEADHHALFNHFGSRKLGLIIGDLVHRYMDELLAMEPQLTERTKKKRRHQIMYGVRDE